MLHAWAICCFGTRLSHVHLFGGVCDDGPLQDCRECHEYRGVFFDDEVSGVPCGEFLPYIQKQERYLI